MNVVSQEQVVFFCDLAGFGGIRSTQPTGECYNRDAAGNQRSMVRNLNCDFCDFCDNVSGGK